MSSYLCITGSTVFHNGNGMFPSVAIQGLPCGTFGAEAVKTYWARTAAI